MCWVEVIKEPLAFFIGGLTGIWIGFKIFGRWL